MFVALFPRKSQLPNGFFSHVCIRCLKRLGRKTANINFLLSFDLYSQWPFCQQIFFAVLLSHGFDLFWNPSSTVSLELLQSISVTNHLMWPHFHILQLLVRTDKFSSLCVYSVEPFIEAFPWFRTFQQLESQAPLYHCWDSPHMLGASQLVSLGSFSLHGDQGTFDSIRLILDL